MRQAFRLAATAVALAFVVPGVSPALAKAKTEKVSTSGNKAETKKVVVKKAASKKSVRKHGAKGLKTATGKSKKSTKTAAKTKPAAKVARKAKTVAKTAGIPLPERNPARESVAVAAGQTPVGESVVVDPAARATNVRKTLTGPDYQSLLAPLLNYALSADDQANLKAALREAYKGNGEAEAAVEAKLQDQSARKLALWYAYRSGHSLAGGKEIEQFRLTDPEWPNQDLLRQRAETAFFMRDADPASAIAFFDTSGASTGAGKAALASALIATGEEAKAKSLVVSAWREHNLSEKVEKRFLDKFAAMLSAEDHKVRIERLLYADSKDRTAAALRTLKLLGDDDKKAVGVRIAMAKRTKKSTEPQGAAAPIDALKANVGLFFDRIQWLRRSDQEEEAWKLLLAAPSEPEKLLDLKEWWIERRLNCRTALNAGQPEIAYEIAKNHGPISGEHYADAEFLAGWIALRQLNKPQVAKDHFLALRTAVTTPKAIARAEYWLGRASLVLGDEQAAGKHLAAAALYPMTYYGELARQGLEQTPTDLVLPPTPLPTEADVTSFLSRDAVRAMGIARAADLDGLIPVFLNHLAGTLENPAELVLLAEFALQLDMRQASVRMSKIAFNRGKPIFAYAFPSDVLPEYKALNDGVESALVHALSRQESEFNAGAKSPVGARGMMQLMPKTAKAVAGQYKVQFNLGSLTGSPSYNVMLGSAHLTDLVNDYRGSYIMALAAYNAGGARVSQWVEAFGDPRAPGVDPIDWVERIPFTETREYVQKILESVQIYRARLEGPHQALQLAQDLYRGRRVTPGQRTAAVQGEAPAP